MNEELYIKIKQYYTDQLSPDERASFEAQMQSDETLAEEARSYALMYETIQSYGEESLNDDLMKLGKEMMQMEATQQIPVTNEATIRKFKLPTYVYAIAAVVLLLIIFVPMWMNSNGGQNNVDPDKMFAQGFSLPPAPEARDDTATAWKRAYDVKDYATTIANLEALVADSTYGKPSEAYLFIGISQLALDNPDPDKALEALNKVSDESYSSFSAQWYKALAYLKKGDLETAQPLLESIAADSGHPNNAQAKEILEGI